MIWDLLDRPILSEFVTWVYNDNHCIIWEAINHPYNNSNGRLSTPPEEIDDNTTCAVTMLTMLEYAVIATYIINNAKYKIYVFEHKEVPFANR